MDRSKVVLEKATGVRCTLHTRDGAHGCRRAEENRAGRRRQAISPVKGKGAGLRHNMRRSADAFIGRLMVASLAQRWGCAGFRGFKMAFLKARPYHDEVSRNNVVSGSGGHHRVLFQIRVSHRPQCSLLLSLVLSILPVSGLASLSLLFMHVDLRNHQPTRLIRGASGTASRASPALPQKE